MKQKYKGCFSQTKERIKYYLEKKKVAFSEAFTFIYDSLPLCRLFNFSGARENCGMTNASAFGGSKNDF